MLKKNVIIIMTKAFKIVLVDNITNQSQYNVGHIEKMVGKI